MAQKNSTVRLSDSELPENEDVDFSTPTEVIPVESLDSADDSTTLINMAPAHGFSASKTDTIGVMLPLLTTHYDRMLHGIHDVIAPCGYSVILANAQQNENDAIEGTTLLLEKQVDGIIFIGQLITSRLIRTLKAINEVIPVILVDQIIQNSTIPSILQDNYAGAAKMMKYLISQGHRRIAFIKGLEYECAAQDRYRAYRDILKQNNIKLVNEYVANGNYTIPGGYEAMSSILARSSQIPTAVFASNDDMALGAMRAMYDRGLKIPDDISLTGFDNASMSSYLQPQLTTVRQNQYNTGKRAAELVFQLIQMGNRAEKTTLLFDQELIIRESVKSVSAET